MRQFMATIAFFGDILVLYLALFAALVIRYGGAAYDRFLAQHFFPFSIIFAIWLVVFYIAGLYDLRHLRNNLLFFKILSLTLAVNAILAILFFYLIPVFGITPKTNLFLFIGIFAIGEMYWRRALNRATEDREPGAKLVLLGEGRTAKEIADFLRTNPQFGYELSNWVKENSLPHSFDHASVVVVPRRLKKDEGLAKKFYHLLTMGTEIYDLPTFYEMTYRQVPLREIDEEWFLENISEHRKFYDDLKRAGEFVFALVLGIFFLPLELAIVVLVALTSPGPVIYKQTRIGRNGLPFTLYKFRTMHRDAEKNGPQWAKPGDGRSTLIGQILRASHLDELPQLWNIIRGDLSFVGPRPERPEFVTLLEGKIPFYNIRHLIKPGVTGWAQINYPYGASEEDAYHKLQYDIYYLKNRSAILDLAIIIKTLKSLFVNPT